jgi:hypothetical protein
VGAKIFITPMSSRLALGAQPDSYPIGILGSFPGVKLTTHLQLVPRSRKRGTIHPLPHSPPWRTTLPFSCSLSCYSHLELEHRASVKTFVSLQFTDGRTPWTSERLVARPLPKHRTTQTHQTSTPCVGF